MKTIYFEPSWKFHSTYKTLVKTPPEEYEFTYPAFSSGIFQIAASKRFNYFVQHTIDELLPINLTKSYLTRKSPNSDSCLTYAQNHVVFRSEPWVIDFDPTTIVFPISYSWRHFYRYKKIVEKLLSSQNCKGILCWTYGTKKAILNNYNSTDLKNKAQVVPFAVESKHAFRKQYKDDSRVKLLFVGSGNIPNLFHIKGGKEAIEAFRILLKKNPNLELVMRSDIAQDVKSRYLGVPNLRFIDYPLSHDALEAEFTSADIMLLPAHFIPVNTFLEAMSYELPIVTIDACDNEELVEHGVTGLVIKKSSKIPYYIGNGIIDPGTPNFMHIVSNFVDPEVVSNLVISVQKLIDNASLRREMGKKGRAKVESGCFSIAHRNKLLKKFLDNAVGS